MLYFYPRPPRGGRPDIPVLFRCMFGYFYPRPPRGGRRLACRCPGQRETFLSTPSARRATCVCCDTFTHGKISIHALREEGDKVSGGALAAFIYFYPRPPRGGRPAAAIHGRGLAGDFYPRPPRGGRLLGGSLTLCIANFYPRPPRGGRRQPVLLRRRGAIFLSTPSARRATFTVKPYIYYRRFLSTPSARRATTKGSIHLDI